jgi:uncharacterized protein YoaH (UPF0181 family)
MDVRLPDGTVIRGVPEGMSKADLVSKLASNGYDTSSLMPAAPKEQPGMLKSLGAGLGSGVGNVALGAQNLVGMGLEKLGAQSAGQWLQRDAATGKEKLKREVSPFKEANPMTAGGGELVGEIVGSLPVGGALAKGVSMIPGASARVAPLIQSLRSGGMSTGQALAPVATAQGAKQIGTRIAGGAATGAATAAVLDPQDAALGAGIGAALPVVGRAVQGVARGPVKKEVVEARNLGYTIPPSQADSSLSMKMMEGVSGKIATAQAASAKNQNVTNSLVAKSLGLADDRPITLDDLSGIRAEAGKAYQAIENLPVKQGTKADSLTNTPETPDINPKQMVFDLRVARNDADAYYKAYGRSADPEQLKKAKSAKTEATRLEKELEDYAESMGQTELLPALREARQTIAKTYTVEKALNPQTGSVDARALAKELRKNKPLSGELKQVAEFASRYPKAAQTPEQMGSLPGLSALDWTSGASLGTLGAIGSGSPMGLMYAALPLARPAARSFVTSNMAQNSLTKAQNPNAPFLVNALRGSIPAIAGQEN